MSLPGPPPRLPRALRSVLQALHFVDEHAPCAGDDPPRPLELSCAFSSFAPTIMSSEELDTMKNPSPMRMRYVAVKLARGLLRFFDKENDAKCVVVGSPLLRRESAAFLREMGSDAAAGRDVVLRPETLSIFGEILLSAALHSSRRDAFVTAILTLSHDDQDILAEAVSTVLVDDGFNDEEYDTSLNRQTSLGSSHFPSEESNPESYSSSFLNDFQENSLSVPKSGILKENISLENTCHIDLRKRSTEKHTEIVSRNTNAVKAESAELRERVLALEQELRAKTAQVAAITAQTTAARQTAMSGGVLSKENTSNESGSTDILTADMELLRAKAASADALQTSLTKASARLEQAGDVKKRLEELEKENAEYRDGEDRLHNRISILETQLEASSARAESLVQVTEGLASDLQERELELSTATEDIERLNYKLNAANIQIASLLGAASSKTCTHSSTQESSDREPYVDSRAHSSLSNPNMNPTSEEIVAVQRHVDDQRVFHSHGDIEYQHRQEGDFRTPHVSLDAATAALHAELGVMMSWNDIVECVRGVVDAMREMDEAEAASQSLMRSGHSGLASSHAIRKSCILLAGTDESHIRLETGTEGTSSPPREKLVEPKQESEETDASVHDEVAGHLMNRDSQDENASVLSKTGRHASAQRFLQDFIEVDMRMEAASKSGGDDFDFVADETNVAELSLGQAQTPANGSARITSSALNELPGQNLLSTPQSATDEQERRINRGHVVSRESGSNSTNTMSRDNGDEANIYDSKSRSGSELTAVHGIVTPKSKYSQSRDIILSAASINGKTSRTWQSQEQIIAGSFRGSGVRMNEKQNRHSTDDPSRAETSPTAQASSIRLLIQQLADSRDTVDAAHAAHNVTERECAELRQELALLIKEVDSVMAQRDALDKHEDYLLKEKERLVTHLSQSLQARVSELACAYDDIKSLRREVTSLNAEKCSLCNEVLSLNRQLSDSIRLQEETLRSQEVDIARLGAQLEASEVLARKLSECVTETDVIKDIASEARRGYYQELMDTVRTEKEIAEAAREESRQVARFQAEKLAEIHASAQVAAAAREYDVQLLMRKARKNTRVGSFLRRIVSHDSSSVFNTSLALRPSDENRER